jgi:hypothetical protein
MFYGLDTHRRGRMEDFEKNCNKSAKILKI